MYDSIRLGRDWLDTDGKPIQAHGFSVIRNESEELWYWYGENKEKTVGGRHNHVWHWGVRLYTSPDLYNWTDRGLIIPPQPDDLLSPLHPTYCMDRPHILFCEKTGKYVAWLKIMAGEVSQFMSVMTADRFEGPYTFARRIYKPLNMDTGDFCLHADPDGTGYIWFERPHFQLICATLTEDYTAVTGEYSVHYDGLLPPLTREAPTYFERNGKRYLFTSGTSGYYPNPSRVCMFDDPHGEYRDLGDPFIGDRTNHQLFLPDYQRDSAPRHGPVYRLCRPVDAPMVCKAHGQADHLRHGAAFQGLQAGHEPKGGGPASRSPAAAQRKHQHIPVCLAPHGVGG